MKLSLKDLGNTLSRNEMKNIIGGVKDAVDYEKKCSGTCKNGETCAVPTACTQCQCGNSGPMC